MQGTTQDTPRVIRRKTRITFRAVLCVLAMVLIAILAFLYWGVNWGSILLFAISAGCIAAMIYSWITAKRIERQLNEVEQSRRGGHTK